MRYLLLIHEDERAMLARSDAETAKVYEQYGQFAAALAGAGKHVGGERLRPTSTATSVRVRSDKKLLTDGPFAETKEQLGGFFVIEAKDLDEAIEWAAKIPSARWGTVEVRPIWERPLELGDPGERS